MHYSKIQYTVKNCDIFEVILIFDLITTYIGLKYFKCFEVNPFIILGVIPVVILRILIFIPFLIFQKAYIFHIFTLLIVLNNVINWFMPFHVAYILAVYIGGRLIWIIKG